MRGLPVVTAAILAFAITALLGLWLVPLMRRIKCGQTILDIGPNWHKSKQGTPTMGGIQFAAGIAAAVMTGYLMLRSEGGGVGHARLPVENLRVTLGLLMALAFGFIGFIDDYIKVVKKRNLGLSAKQKLVMQFAVAIVYLAGLHIAGDHSTRVNLPLLGQLEIGLLYYPLAVLGIVYFINVVNFTDGIDGLCSSVTFVSALGMLGCATIIGRQDMAMMSAALAGGCVGFLVWNFHPARIFMGDTGSMFLGGMVAALAFGLGIPAYLILLGLVYIIEGLSVIIQTLYFKHTRRRTGTGKRLFKMSPIHHHFEMSGWGESRIVVVFSLIQLLACGAALLAVMRM